MAGEHTLVFPFIWLGIHHLRFPKFVPYFKQVFPNHKGRMETLSSPSAILSFLSQPWTPLQDPHSHLDSTEDSDSTCIDDFSEIIRFCETNGEHRSIQFSMSCWAPTFLLNSPLQVQI